MSMGGVYEFLLIRGAEVFSPEPLGKCDILVAPPRILRIARSIEFEALKSAGFRVKVIDADELVAVPGFIDQHVHINGGGGEGGPRYRTPPIQLSQLVKAGITSVVGTLGTDGVARSLRELLMKARGLEEEGVSTWIYTGSYQVPSPTLTGSILSDIVLIDKVIGVKIALSDHRSSHPTPDEVRRIASEARVGGILSGKAGVVHVHMGSEKTGFEPILRAVEGTEIPLAQFVITHVNRAERVLEQAIEFGRMGGNVDVTSGVSPGYGFRSSVKPSEAIKTMLRRGVPLERITMSSDGNGSMPLFNEKGEVVRMLVAPVSATLREFRDMVLEEKIPVEHALRIVSTNVAENLKLSGKGRLAEGYDADILLLTRSRFELRYVVARGEVLMENGRLVRVGTFE